MDKKNNIVEKKWKIVVTMKYSFLIDGELSLGFRVKAINIVNYLRNYLSTKSQRKLLKSEKYLMSKR